MTNDEPTLSRRILVQGLALGAGTAKNGSMNTPSASRHVAVLSVGEFGARGDGRTDDSGAFQRAIAAASRFGSRLRIPAGRYRIARTLEITRGICIEGDGVEHTVLEGAVGPGHPVLHILATATDSVIGPALAGLRITGGEGDAPCDGVRLSTGGTGAAIHQAVLRDLYITHVGTGLALSGVVYRSCFENITVSKGVSRYGIYCDAGFEDVTYNSFRDIEVTDAGPSAYAFWIHSNYSNFTNLTADSCCYFSSPGGSLRNLAIEGISADKPATDVLLTFNQMQIIEAINLIGIDPRKCPSGIKVIGQGTVINGIRCMSLQPQRLFVLDQNSEGVVMGVQTERAAAMIEDYIPAAILERWVFMAARAVTRRRSG